MVTVLSSGAVDWRAAITGEDHSMLRYYSIQGILIVNTLDVRRLVLNSFSGITYALRYLRYAGGNEASIPIRTYGLLFSIFLSRLTWVEVVRDK